MTKITCPHCKSEFEIDKALEDHIRGELEEGFDKRLDPKKC